MHAKTFRIALAILVSAGLCRMAFATKPAGENVHHPGVDCRLCHTSNSATLSQDHATARTMVVPDLEARCGGCHGPLDASHRTGVQPKKSVPESLPLSADGRITCSTCHFMHGESNAFGDFVRIDNRRGGLCLTCHEISELE